MNLPAPFAGWSVDTARGDLVDDAGNRYTPGVIRAAWWLLRCSEMQSRLMYSDLGAPRPVFDLVHDTGALTPVESAFGVRPGATK